jgi:hypothetical protein
MMKFSQFREKLAELCGFSLHVFLLAPFNVGSLVVIVQFVVDLVVLLEIFRAPRQDMDVDMLNNSILEHEGNVRNLSFFFYSNLNALSGIGTVLNGNVGRRNAVEKFHASLDYLRREKQIGQFVWLHVWHPSARFQWHHQHVWEFKKTKSILLRK